MEMNTIKAILKIDSEDYTVNREARAYAGRLLKLIEQNDAYDTEMYEDADRLASNFIDALKASAVIDCEDHCKGE